MINRWRGVYGLVVGALMGVTVVGLLTIGVLLLPIVVTAVAAGVLVKALRGPEMAAAISALAVGPLYAAWLNRGGPGTRCRVLPDATECADLFNPWPLLVVGAVLLFGGLLAVNGARKVNSRWQVPAA